MAKNPPFCRVACGACGRIETVYVTLLCGIQRSGNAKVFRSLARGKDDPGLRSDMLRATMMDHCDVSDDETSGESLRDRKTPSQTRAPLKLRLLVSGLRDATNSKSVEGRSNPNQDSFVISKMRFRALRGLRIVIVRDHEKFPAGDSTCNLACMLYSMPRLAIISHVSTTYV